MNARYGGQSRDMNIVEGVEISEIMHDSKGDVA